MGHTLVGCAAVCRGYCTVQAVSLLLSIHYGVRPPALCLMATYCTCAWTAVVICITDEMTLLAASHAHCTYGLTRGYVLICMPSHAGMWRDGILQPPINTTNSSSSSDSSSNASTVYTLTQNPGVFASNFIPLWAGLADGDVLTGSRAVDSLNKSGLVQPAGKAMRGGGASC